MENEADDKLYPCYQCAFSESMRGCSAMSEECGSLFFWRNLGDSNKDLLVTVGPVYRLVTNDPAGGCTKCAADIDDGVCNVLSTKGCTEISNSFWVKK